MQWEDRNLHRKSDCETKEQPSTGRRRKVCALGEFDEVECDLSDAVISGNKHGGENRHEHECRARHRVQEELRRRIFTAFVTPSTDEEVHRYEHDLEEHEEQEEVEAQEGTHDASLE